MEAQRKFHFRYLPNLNRRRVIPSEKTVSSYHLYSANTDSELTYTPVVNGSLGLSYFADTVKELSHSIFGTQLSWLAISVKRIISNCVSILNLIGLADPRHGHSYQWRERTRISPYVIASRKGALFLSRGSRDIDLWKTISPFFFNLCIDFPIAKLKSRTIYNIVEHC